MSADPDWPADRLPPGPIVVTPHARERFRQHFRCFDPDHVIDIKIAAALRAARKVRQGHHGHGWTVRTDRPCAFRAVVELSYDGFGVTVVTVMPGSKTKGNVAAQKARRAQRRTEGALP